jgi:hypothetical protein
MGYLTADEEFPSPTLGGPLQIQARDITGFNSDLILITFVFLILDFILKQCIERHVIDLFFFAARARSIYIKTVTEGEHINNNK